MFLYKKQGGFHVPAHEVERPGDLCGAVVDLPVARVVLVRVGRDPLVRDYVARGGLRK